MNVIFPGNIMSFVIIMIPLVMFDVLEDVPYLNTLFEADDNKLNIND